MRAIVSVAMDFYIGKPNGLESADYFKGSLDEMKVLQTLADPMRLRLEYESEREGSRLSTLSFP